MNQERDGQPASEQQDSTHPQGDAELVEAPRALECQHPLHPGTPSQYINLDYYVPCAIRILMERIARAKSRLQERGGVFASFERADGHRPIVKELRDIKLRLLRNLPLFEEIANVELQWERNNPGTDGGYYTASAGLRMAQELMKSELWMTLPGVVMEQVRKDRPVSGDDTEINEEEPAGFRKNVAFSDAATILGSPGTTSQPPFPGDIILHRDESEERKADLFYRKSPTYQPGIWSSSNGLEDTSFSNDQNYDHDRPIGILWGAMTVYRWSPIVLYIFRQGRQMLGAAVRRMWNRYCGIFGLEPV